ncbi:MAG: ABC transporter six-transmembrane domain-containing protein [Gemmatimonadota bacterium]
MRLRELLRGHERGVAFTLSLASVEYIAWVLEPSLFGPVLDGLIDTRNHEPKARLLAPLVFWAIAFAVNSGAGAIRRVFEQKIYLRLFADLAARVVELGKRKRVPLTAVQGRIELTKGVVTFLQHRVPEILDQGIAIVGAMVSLAFFDFRLAAACAAVLVPVLWVQRMYTKAVTKLQAEVHDRVEAVSIVLHTGDPDQVRSYLLETARSQQAIANWGARVFVVLRVVLFVIFLVVLFVAIDLDDFTTGRLYSIVAYIWTFITSTEYIPDLIEDWIAFKDIEGRLRLEGDL